MYFELVWKVLLPHCSNNLVRVDNPKNHSYFCLLANLICYLNYHPLTFFCFYALLALGEQSYSQLREKEL